MAKRIITKIGNIFCVEVDGMYKCFFQYVANDIYQLNSSVIRVFSRHYDMDYVPNMDEIVNDKVSFYSHTVLRAGIYYGAWYKVGTHKDVGDLNEIAFRMHEEYDIAERTKSYRWYMWKLDGTKKFIGEMTDEYRHLDVGFVYAYTNVVHRI